MENDNEETLSFPYTNQEIPELNDSKTGDNIIAKAFVEKTDNGGVLNFTDFHKDNTPEEIIDKGKIKKPQEVVACVFDYGTFISLAEKLSETYKKVYYYTPTSQEFYSISDLIKATGLKNVERVTDIFAPEFLKKVDLFVFPDIGYGGLQKYLKSIGKFIWGSFSVDEIEVVRTLFISTLKSMNLPIIHSVTITGLSKLKKHLAVVKNKYVKVDTYRGNMDTWHHIDIEHSEPEFNRLEMQFGGVSETIKFVVQDSIEPAFETGIDTWSIDGKFPSKCSQGYEKKNELYLAALGDYDKIPKQVKKINDALAPLFKKFKYRNFFATEIRVKNGIPYFIDPTMRMPGQSGEQLLETCSNLAEVIWYGSQGIMIEPIFKYKFSAAATLHYKGSDGTADGWGVLRIPEKIKQWMKPCHYCKLDGLYHFPPRGGNDDYGIILGASDTIQGAIDKLKENYKELTMNEPIHCDMEGFMEILQDVEKATKAGIIFTDQKIPNPKNVL